jgi:cytochrome c
MGWDIPALQAFLTKPKDFIPKTKMSFAGLKKQKDRHNVIAYLASIEAEE